MEPSALYEKLFAHFGPQHWWPVQVVSKRRARGTLSLRDDDKRFEIIVGAILTQNTAWKNVEKAIANLHAVDALYPQRIVSMPSARLSRLIRPAGYFNQKTKKLKIFSRWIITRGGLESLKSLPTNQLRAKLLSLWGIGPETADSLLLYAFGRPVFVVDVYTHRLCRAAGFGAMDYQECQRYFTDRLPRRVKLFNEYHALVVAWGKLYGNKKTRPEAEKLLRLGR